jgi:hypothetical protein
MMSKNDYLVFARLRQESGLFKKERYSPATAN